MKLNEIANTHYNWLEEMNWNNTNFLEAMGLISSEIGESANECFAATPTELFKYELADVALRIMGILKRFNSDIDLNISDSYSSVIDFLNQVNWSNRNNLECLAIIMSRIGLTINECRGISPTKKFYPLLIQNLICIIELAKKNNINLEKAIKEKIQVNLLKGTRGRIK